MINLLPPTEKRELSLLATQKKVLIVLVYLLIAFLFFILILYCLQTYIGYQVDYLQTLLQQKEEEFKGSQFHNFGEIISKTNQDIAKIKNLWQEQLLITPFFEKLASLTPQSIYFSGITFRKIVQAPEPKKEKAGAKSETKPESGKEATFAEVAISGFASNRGALFYFKENLESEKSFQDIYFTPSSWVTPTEVDFSLNLRYVY